MKVSHEKIDEVNAKITVNLTPEDYNPIVDKTIKDQAKKASMPGFRPGKVPASHIRRLYGQSILVDEVNRLVSEEVNKHLTDSKINYLGNPLPIEDEGQADYKWDFKDNFAFSFELGVAPEVTNPFTKESEFTEYSIQPDADTIAERVINLRNTYGKMSNPETSEEGDVLFGEFNQGTEEDAINNKTSIRISEVADKKIQKSLVGLKKDDKVIIDLKKAYKEVDKIASALGITAEQVAELKDTKFEFTVSEVSRLEPAELNQEFFDKLYPEGEVKTEEEFTERVTKELEEALEQPSLQQLRNDMYKFGIKEVQVELPKEFLKKWLKSSNPNIKDEELEEGFEQFLENLKWTLIENKILEENNLKVEYEDVLTQAKNFVSAQLRMYNYGQQIDEEQIDKFAVELLGNQEQSSRMFDEAKALKVYNHLVEQVKIKKKKISYKEFEKLQEEAQA